MRIEPPRTAEVSDQSTKTEIPTLCRTDYTSSRPFKKQGLVPHFRTLLLFLWLLMAAAAGCAQRGELPHGCYQPLSPSELPASLSGVWDVSLCIHDAGGGEWGHAWIRFENVTTGEVRGIGRYFPTAGEWRDDDGRLIHPAVMTAGVWMGLEQKYEADAVKHIVRTVRVRDPQIYRGWGNGRGHRLLRDNCVTHARNAWHFYSGEWYELGALHLPGGLKQAVLARNRDNASSGNETR